jgi:hypothetical protein
VIPPDAGTVLQVLGQRVGFIALSILVGEPLKRRPKQFLQRNRLPPVLRLQFSKLRQQNAQPGLTIAPI